MRATKWPGKRIATCLTLSIAALSGCDMTGLSTSPAPAPRPETPAPPPPAKSAESLAIERHFARVEAELRTQGLLRLDDGGPDVSYSTRDLVENFTRIALFDEYAISRGRLVARESESALRRWSRPVRFAVHFGDSIPEARRTKDRNDIATYAQRLARATGHPVSLGEEANFHILILSEDERLRYNQTLKRLVPGLSSGDIASILTMPRTTLCHVYAFSGGSSAHTYNTAVAVIRAEHPDLMRLSCIHEELAQGLGLANDSRAARPSIFNDDEEFALLTRHDELLLKMLYDPRLTPGMTPESARPVVEEIAAELMGGTS